MKINLNQRTQYLYSNIALHHSEKNQLSLVSKIILSKTKDKIIKPIYTHFIYKTVVSNTTGVR